jgi:hypothetical protein
MRDDIEARNYIGSLMYFVFQDWKKKPEDYKITTYANVGTYLIKKSTGICVVRIDGDEVISHLATVQDQEFADRVLDGIMKTKEKIEFSNRKTYYLVPHLGFFAITVRTGGQAAPKGSLFHSNNPEEVVAELQKTYLRRLDNLSKCEDVTYLEKSLANGQGTFYV